MPMVTATCTTCPRHCVLGEGQRGVCQARGNVGGEVVCLNYGRATSLALDPVEKKPFSRWMSGSYLLSVGSYGCNLSCPFCQNYTISQAGPDDVAWHNVPPQVLVEEALSLRTRACIGIAYTYNEPLVGWEYVRDTGILAHEAGLLNAVVSNGAVEPHVFASLLPLIDAVNFDLKAFNAGFYRDCGIDVLECVKANIAAASACPSCHVEVTTLFVPTMSSPEDVLAAGKWVASIDPGIVYHLSQYHPSFLMDAPPVADADLRALIGQLGTMLDTVVAGNMR